MTQCPLQLNAHTSEVTHDGVTLSLPPKKFALLALLIEHYGEVVPYRDLHALTNHRRTKDVSASIIRLRNDITRAFDWAVSIDNEPGRGYRLVQVEKWNK